MCLVVMAVAVVSAATLSGCTSIESKQSAVIRASDQYYKAYLNGDVSQAKQGLEQMIQHFQSRQAEVLGRGGQAGYLFGCYARLYVFDQRAGDKDNAEVALTQARFWHLQAYESDAAGRSRVTLHEFLSYQTPEWIAGAVDKLDEGSNRGSKPKYVQHLAQAQPNTMLEPTTTAP